MSKGSSKKSQGPKGSLVFSLKADDKSIRWDYFRVGGNGGQKVNKTSSGARCTHVPSGARGESREERSQLQNRKAAWNRMVQSPIFKAWLTLETATGPSPEAQVESAMRPENIRVEVKQDGKWVDEKTI